MSLGVVEVSELEAIQNPALGAFLIWRAGLSYQGEAALAPPMHVLFLVLPMVLHRVTLEAINSTNKSSGLVLLSTKLGVHQEDLLAINSRAIALRELTLASLGVAIRTELASVDYLDASIGFRDVRGKAVVPERLKPLLAAAEKLGIWFARLPLKQISSTLRVEF